MRIPFLSAMSLLNAADNEPHSYMEIADALRQYGAKADEDCAQLWRRIVFSILISNSDDHLRNHGFLYEAAAGWRLSPAYDLNPVPVDIKPRILTTAIDEADGTASLDLAFEVAAHFGVKAGQGEDDRPRSRHRRRALARNRRRDGPFEPTKSNAWPAPSSTMKAQKLLLRLIKRARGHFNQ